jgi:hypothetical protein
VFNSELISLDSLLITSGSEKWNSDMSKTRFLARRIKQRNELYPSLAEELLLGLPAANNDSEATPQSSSNTKPCPIPVCPNCQGKKIIAGVFSSSECYLCDGTGYDLTDPLVVIKHQAALLAWAKDTLLKQRKQIDKLTNPQPKPNMADAIENFYRDAKRNKHD